MVIVRAFPSVVVLAVLFLSAHPQQKKTEQPAVADERGTTESPVVVKILPTQKTKDEAQQEADDRNQKTSSDRRLVDLTGVLAFVGFLQLLVFGYQAYKLRQTVQSAGEQAQAMERYINEAARSATAMENITAVIQSGNQAVMRAHLTVVIGEALYQERREGQSDLKFEVRPSLVNTGNTPARKVRIRSKADILPIPLPKGFAFPLPDEPTETAENVVGAHQNYILAATVDNFVPDGDVAKIKEGTDRALCAWGVVTYEDMFGKSHTTKFGQWITWHPNGKVFGYYLQGQNDAD